MLRRKMRAVWWMFVVASTVSAQMELWASRTLLEKQLYYVANGKIGVCKYFSLYLGGHDLMLRRKFPGEDTISLEAIMNFVLISSGYISGSGYSERGKVDCMTGFFFATEDTSYSLHLDSIDYAYENLNMVKTTTGTTGYLRIDAEGKLVRPKKLLLTAFKMVDHYGDKVLRKDKDIQISAISFSKTGIRKALAASR